MIDEAMKTWPGWKGDADLTAYVSSDRSMETDAHCALD